MGDARRIQNMLKSASTAASRGAICRDKLYFTIGEGGGHAIVLIEYDIMRAAYMLRRGFRAYDICSSGGTLYIANENRRICRMDEGKT